jgi:hypothetical protein
MGGFLLEFGVKEHRFDPSGEMNIFGRGGKRTIEFSRRRICLIDGRNDTIRTGSFEPDPRR